MTTIEALNELYDEEMNRVFSYSANYLMTVPRKDYEKEFKHHSDRADILKALLEREYVKYE